MADDTAKNDAPDTGDAKEVDGVAPSLDEVHKLNQDKVDGEDNAEVDDTEDKGTDDGASDKDSTDDNAKDDAADEPSGSDDDTDKSDTVASTSPAATQPTSELADTDTTKPGNNKVPIKDADGKTHYFNNLDEVPEDFEPASYKELMRGNKALYQKEVKDEQAQVDAEKQAEVAAGRERAQAMEKDWESDASDLTSAGLLPKDEEENKQAVSDVYTYMEAELKKGNIISSFKQGYKNMMFDREQVKKTEDQKKQNDAKKKRGSLVQAGGSGATPATSSRGGKLYDSPPSGAGLDAVHQNIVENL